MVKKRIFSILLGALSLLALASLARCEIFFDEVHIYSPRDNSTVYSSIIHVEGYADVELNYYDDIEVALYINNFYVASQYSRNFDFTVLLADGFNDITVDVYKNNGFWVSDTITVYCDPF